MRRRALRFLPAALLCIAFPALAQAPMLHEYIEPNAAEDVASSALRQLLHPKHAHTDRHALVLDLHPVPARQRHRDEAHVSR